MTKKEKYTIRTLFLPRLRGRKLREIIAILMLNPLVWLIEGSAWFLFGFLGVIQAKTVAPHSAIWVIMVATLAVIVFPIVYLIIIWLLDIYEREPLRFMIALFMWGVASTVGSLIGNELFGGILTVFLSLFLGNLGAGLGSIGTTVMVAPIVEEIMKGFGLILIAGHHEMDDTMDGIVYGFAVGIGFAAVENFVYFSVAYQEGYTSPFNFLLFVFYRSILCMIGHGCFTATTGMIMGWAKGRGRLAKYAQLFGFLGVLGAVSLHGAFNLTAIIQGAVMNTAFKGFNYPVPLFHGPLVLLMGGIYLIIIFFALRESKARVERETAFQEKRKKEKLIREDKASLEREKKLYCNVCGEMVSTAIDYCKTCGNRNL